MRARRKGCQREGEDSGEPKQQTRKERARLGDGGFLVQRMTSRESPMVLLVVSSARTLDPQSGFGPGPGVTGSEQTFARTFAHLA
jgi:hypothetical protein